MRRQICWEDRLEDRTKREVRVSVLTHGLKWQFKLSTEEQWDYDSPPTPEDWDGLLERVENRYHRRTASNADLELVRRLRATAIGKA